MLTIGDSKPGFNSGIVGRRRGIPMRGRGGPRVTRGNGGNGFYRRNYSREEPEQPGVSSNGDYPDFPSDFTTLPLYPVVPEFIMPYVPPYYQAPYVPPAAVVKNAQIAPAFVPVDEPLIVEMVKKQMCVVV